MLKSTLEYLSKKTQISEGQIQEQFCNPCYQTIYVTKENGKRRKLNVPDENLKLLQRQLLKRVLTSVEVSKFAHCSIERRSIITNAKEHSYSNFFFKVDFKDAFPSTSAKLVTEHLLRWVDAPQEVDKLDLISSIVKLTTLENSIPQGAPASPYILNIVCKDLDEILSEFCTSHDMKYTRYMDDICCSKKTEITKNEREFILQEIRAYGYNINNNKTSYIQRTDAYQPTVTGIRMSKKGMTISSESIEGYRTRIYKACKDFSILESEVFGIISWILQVEKKIPSRLQKVFLKFLTERCPRKLNKYNRYFDEELPY